MMHIPLLEELKGVRLHTLELYKLKGFGERNLEEQGIFDKVYLAQSAEDIPLPIAPNAQLADYALEGAVESADVKKCKFVIGHYPVKDVDTVKEIFSTLIYSAEKTYLSESVLLDMVKIPIEDLLQSASGHGGDMLKSMQNKIAEGLFFENDIVNRAARAGFYQVAEYLLRSGATIKPLNKYDLFDIGNGEDHSAAFIWLFAHGASIHRELLGSVLCNEHFYSNFAKFAPFNSDKNVEATTELLINLGITDHDHVNKITEKCHVIARIIDPLTPPSISHDDQIRACLQKRCSVDEIKFLIDNGLKLQSYTVLDALVNYPDPHVVNVILEEAHHQGLNYYDPYKKYLVPVIEAHMDHCQSNLALAQYLGIEKDIDWNLCIDHGSSHQEL